MKSNLSKFNINDGNHIVAALTQEAINSSMKEKLYFDMKEHTSYVLYTVDKNNKSVYYTINKDTNVEKLPAAFPKELRRKSLYSELESLNLFSIPSDKRTDEQNAILEKAYDEYYLYNAFRFTEGLPMGFAGFDLQKFNPLELIESTDPKNCGAIYTQCFSEVVILEIKEFRRKISVNIIRQSDSPNPWFIKYKILYNLKSTSYNNLPDEVKEELKNHFAVSEKNIDTMFEIGQLMLDLTTLSRSSEPDIRGIEKDSYNNVRNAFEEFIKDNLQDVLVHGYVSKPSASNYINYIVRPTGYTFSVTKSPVNDPRYRTLNYIMSAQGGSIEPNHYDWEWVSPNDPDKKSGVMAISRAIFFEKINAIFKRGVIGSLRKHIIAKIPECSAVWDLKYEYEIKDDNSADNNVFTYDESQKKYIYPRYSYESESDCRCVYVPPIFAATAQLKFHYWFDGSVGWDFITGNKGVRYPAIVYTVDLTLYTDIMYDSGHSTGNIINDKIKCFLGIGIDEYGRIQFHKGVQEIRSCGNIDISGWSQFASFGAINGMIKNLETEMINMIERITGDYKQHFLEEFKCDTNWVMLGNRTFTFSGEEFSDYGDFCTKVKYTNAHMEKMEKLNMRYGIRGNELC